MVILHIGSSDLSFFWLGRAVSFPKVRMHRTFAVFLLTTALKKW